MRSLAGATISDATPTRITIDSAPVILEYAAPRASEGPLWWNVSDGSSRWVRIDVQAQKAVLLLEVLMSDIKQS